MNLRMSSVDNSFQDLGVTPAWRNREGTLLYEGSVDNPDGAVQGGGSRGPGLGCALSPHGLNPVQHEYQHTNHGDGCRNASPHGKIKWSEEGEDADFLLGLLDEDSHRVVHVPLAEVHNALPLRGDGDGGDGQICSLKGKPIWSEGSPQITLGSTFAQGLSTALWVVQRKRLQVLTPHDFERCKENPASGCLPLPPSTYICLPKPQKLLETTSGGKSLSPFSFLCEL